MDLSDIFISYKREEQAVAKCLSDALERQGWTVWWDPRLRTGERFDDVIEHALRQAKCVIVLWSKRSVKSQYVRDEATYALTRRKLIPAAIEEVNPPFRFEGIQTAHLSGWDGSDTFPGFQKLVQDLASVLGSPPDSPADKGFELNDKAGAEEWRTLVERKKEEPQQIDIRGQSVTDMEARQVARLKTWCACAYQVGWLALGLGIFGLNALSTRGPATPADLPVTIFAITLGISSLIAAMGVFAPRLRKFSPAGDRVIRTVTLLLGIGATIVLFVIDAV